MILLPDMISTLQQKAADEQWTSVEAAVMDAEDLLFSAKCSRTDYRVSVPHRSNYHSFRPLAWTCNHGLDIESQR